MIPATAVAGQSYTITITGGNATNGTASVVLTPGPSGTINVTGGAEPLDIPVSALSVSAQEVSYTPLQPQEGDPVKFRARVRNAGRTAVKNVEVVLTLDREVVARQRVDVDAQGSAMVSLEWKAQRMQGHQLAVVV